MDGRQNESHHEVDHKHYTKISLTITCQVTWVRFVPTWHCECVIVQGLLETDQN